MIKIGLMGIGTVGTGVYKIINNKKEELKGKLNDDIEIKKILVRDLDKQRGINIDRELLTNNVEEILTDSEIDIVVEVMGGMSPAYEYICSALNKGKHVVTANKEVVAYNIQELLYLAEKNNKEFLFEASVGAGIPIIKSLSHIVSINDITKIKGILNGTSNFILSKMMENGTSFKESLAYAQKMGYAEANPKDDIEGDDAARKLAILSTLAFKTKVNAEKILYRGISSIDKEDILSFKRMNKSVKLIATSTIYDKRISASVEPLLIEEKSQFANVNDSFNIVSITGSTVQELQFYGQGAGERSTANAVVCDIIDIVKSTSSMSKLQLNQEEYNISNHIGNTDYYLRVTTKGVKEKEEIINLLKKFNLKYDVLNNEKNFILKIKQVCTEKMEKFVYLLSMVQNNFCYVRIED